MLPINNNNNNQMKDFVKIVLLLFVSFALCEEDLKLLEEPKKVPKYKANNFHKIIVEENKEFKIRKSNNRI